MCKPKISVTFVMPRNGRATANALAHPKIGEGIKPSPILPRNEQCSGTAFALLTTLSTLSGIVEFAVNRFRNIFFSWCQPVWE